MQQRLRQWRHMMVSMITMCKSYYSNWNPWRYHHFHSTAQHPTCRNRELCAKLACQIFWRWAVWKLWIKLTILRRSSVASAFNNNNNISKFCDSFIVPVFDVKTLGWTLCFTRTLQLHYNELFYCKLSHMYNELSLCPPPLMTLTFFFDVFKKHHWAMQFSSSQRQTTSHQVHSQVNDTS